jgi:thiamine kinase-like enzyme
VGLTIEKAIAQVPAWNGARSVSVAPLIGGITNLNYRVDVDGESFVARIASPDARLLGVHRRREHAATVSAWRAGVAPEVFYWSETQGILVTRFVPGRTLTAEEAIPPDRLGRIVAAMRRYHAGLPFVGATSPFSTIGAWAAMARRRGAPVPADLDELIATLRPIRRALSRRPVRAVPCHNDLWGPNLIDDGDRVTVLDWEYAGMGDPFYDLASLAIHHSDGEGWDRGLLEAYAGTVSDVGLARIGLYRVAAELRESLWYLVALALPTATSRFVEMAERHAARCRTALADPRIVEWSRGLDGRAGRLEPEPEPGVRERAADQQVGTVGRTPIRRTPT